MATNYTNDAKYKALKLWAANHPEWGSNVRDLETRWYPAFSFNASQAAGFDQAGRMSLFSFWATGLSLGTLAYTAANPQEMENDFWVKYAAKPPVPAA